MKNKDLSQDFVTEELAPDSTLENDAVKAAEESAEDIACPTSLSDESASEGEILPAADTRNETELPADPLEEENANAEGDESYEALAEDVPEGSNKKRTQKKKAKEKPVRSCKKTLDTKSRASKTRSLKTQICITCSAAFIAITMVLFVFTSASYQSIINNSFSDSAEYSMQTFRGLINDYDKQISDTVEELTKNSTFKKQVKDKDGSSLPARLTLS